MAHQHTELVRSVYDAVEDGDAGKLEALLVPGSGLDRELMGMRAEPEWYARSGDGRVLVFAQLTTESGETMSGAHVWTIEGDRIAGFESFDERMRAMEVLGPETLIQDHDD